QITPQLRAGMVTKLYAEAFPGETAVPAPSGESAAAAPVRPAPPPEVQADAAPAGRKISRLSKFYVRGEYARGTPAPAPARERKPVQDGNRGGRAGAKDKPPAAADASTPAIARDEMEARRAARIEIPPAELQAMGEARAQAIRSWLVETGKVAPERI